MASPANETLTRLGTRPADSHVYHQSGPGCFGHFLSEKVWAGNERTAKQELLKRCLLSRLEACAALADCRVNLSTKLGLFLA